MSGDFAQKCKLLHHRGADVIDDTAMLTDETAMFIDETWGVS